MARGGWFILLLLSCCSCDFPESLTRLKGTPPRLPVVMMARRHRIEMSPLVVRGLDVGRCVERWADIDYLSEGAAEEKVVAVHVSADPRLNFITKNFEYRFDTKFRSLRFSTAVKRCFERVHEEFFIDKEEKYYLRALGRSPHQDVTRLQTDYPLLSEGLNVPSWLPSEKIFSSVLRVSSAGVQLWTHYDIMDNVLIQVVGRKRIVLFDPTDAPYLYMKGDKSRVIDIDCQDDDEFPLFKRALQYRTLLLPGDLLYIPALWFHNTIALEPCVNVNIFWRHLDADMYDPKDLYGNRDLVLASKAFSSLRNVILSLNALPSPYREFYYLRVEETLKSAAARRVDQNSAQN